MRNRQIIDDFKDCKNTISDLSFKCNIGNFHKDFEKESQKAPLSMMLFDFLPVKTQSCPTTKFRKYYHVKISYPSSVTATVTSHCAEGSPSSV